MRSYREAIIRDSGKTVDNAVVEVRELGTSTPVTDLYLVETGGDALSPAQVLSKDGGVVEFWLATSRDVTLYVTDNNDQATYTGSNQTISFPAKTVDYRADRAYDVVFVATGTLSAGNVQDAIAEENTERQAADAALASAVDARIPLSQKGQPNGVAPLDGSGKVAGQYLPAAPGDAVTSVNGETGDVVLDAADVGAATPADVTAEALARTEADTTEATAREDADDALAADVATRIPLAEKGAANGVAPLGADSKVPAANLPDIAITNTAVVADEAAMLALSAQEGDVAVRTDLSATFILKGSDPSVLANWQQLATPTDAVISVNGETGVVDLSAADVGAPTSGALDAEVSARTAGDNARPTLVVADARFYPNERDLLARVRAAYSQIRVPGSAISLRFDDNPLTDYTVAFPALRDRRLPAGFAVNSATIGTSGFATQANLLEMQGRAMELMNHSATHANWPADAPPTIETFIAEAITSKATLEQMGFMIDSFVQPGTWAGLYHFDSAAKLDAEAGRLLRAAYASVEAYIPDTYALAGGLKPMPQHFHYGHSHPVTATDTNNLATLTAFVDKAVERQGSALRMIFHSSHIGQTGKLSLANFLALLDYIKTRRDDGRIDVLAPTSMVYAERGERENLLRDGGFEEQATSSYKYWKSAGAPVIAANGETGNAVQVSTGNTIEQNFTAGNFRRLLFVGRARPATDGVTATSRVIWRSVDQASTTPVNVSESAALAASTWTTVRHLFGTHPSAVYEFLWLQTFGDTYRWDNAALYKV